MVYHFPHLSFQYSVSMFSRSVAVNQLLYERSKPVILTTARTNEDTFHVSLQSKTSGRWYLSRQEFADPVALQTLFSKKLFLCKAVLSNKEAPHILKECDVYF